MSFTSFQIKEKARELGFRKIGIAKAKECPDDQNNLNTWLEEDRNGTMVWINSRKEERGNLFNYFPEAKSVISVGLNYYVGKTQKDLNADYKFSNYAWGDDYHDVIKKNLYELVEFMHQILGDFNYRVCVDTSPLMEKKWAMRSGLGWIGKNTNLITRDFGSWIFLSEIIIDKILEVDDFFDMDLCGTCTACIDHCPTDIDRAGRRSEHDASTESDTTTVSDQAAHDRTIDELAIRCTPTTEDVQAACLGTQAPDHNSTIDRGPIMLPVTRVRQLTRMKSADERHTQATADTESDP